MYLRMVLRSWPVRSAMAATVSPCRARSKIMTSSPSVTTASSHDAGRHLGGRRATGSGAGPSRQTEDVSFSASGENSGPPAVCVMTTGASRGLEHPAAEQVEPGATVHGAFDRLEPADLALDRARRPRSLK